MPLAALKKKPAPAKPVPARAPVTPARKPGPPAAPSRMQTKLEVGPAGDRFEQEADRIAGSVMRMHSPGISLAAAPLRISRKCAACEEKEERLQKKPAGSTAASI